MNSRFSDEEEDDTSRPSAFPPSSSEEDGGELPTPPREVFEYAQFLIRQLQTVRHIEDEVSVFLRPLFSPSYFVCFSRNFQMQEG
jgi:hypothetical protein